MLLLNVLLALAWVALTGQLSPINFGFGFAVGFLLLWLARALHEFDVDGVPTTVGFHAKVLEDPRFISGRFDTSFVETMRRDHPVAP